MAKTQTLYLSGKGFWLHRLFEPDDFKGQQFWSMKLYLDPASMKAFKAAQLNNRIKKDEEGESVTFRRYVKKKWKLKANESPEFAPPRVVDSDGNLWADRGLIGNGSAVTAKLEVYQTRVGPGTRLEEVRVDNWIEYNPDGADQAEPDDEDDGPRPF